jgi:hypothetical protein
MNCSQLEFNFVCCFEVVDTSKTEPSCPIVADEFDELDEILDSQHSDMQQHHQKHQQQTTTTTTTRTRTTASLVQYQFEICDILLNIGPCGQSIVAESINSDLGGHIDLVTTSGYSKNGAVSVLQRTIRPDVLTTFELNDIVDMWSVFACEPASDDTTFLFLSESLSLYVCK